MNGLQDCTNNTFANSSYCVQQVIFFPFFFSLTLCSKSQLTSDNAFASSVVVNTALFLIFFVLFLIVRRLKWFRPLYEIHKDITEPGNGLFGWLSATWAVSDHEIETKRGLDQIAYLVTLKYLFWVRIEVFLFSVLI
jgi:hypothetical protein